MVSCVCRSVSRPARRDTLGKCSRKGERFDCAVVGEGLTREGDTLNSLFLYGKLSLQDECFVSLACEGRGSGILSRVCATVALVADADTLGKRARQGDFLLRAVEYHGLVGEADALNGLLLRISIVTSEDGNRYQYREYEQDQQDSAG